jgi:hypothetical protein
VHKLSFCGRLSLTASVALLSAACGFPEYGGFTAEGGAGPGGGGTSSSVGGGGGTGGGSTTTSTGGTGGTTTSTTGSGSSTSSGCPSGKADCDNDGTCETNTATSITDCGGCGLTCGESHASAICNAGTCVLTCEDGWGNCDGAAPNGCEANLNVDKKNCGECAAVCGTDHATSTCANGACELTCAQGYDNCDLDPSNGCEANFADDVNNCGQCGNKCSYANAQAKCANSTCSVDTCSAPWANCDGNDANGCESNTTSSTAHCGGCNNTCTNVHGQTKCTASTCVPTCDGGYADCDSDPENGCEASTQIEAANCGGCGLACNKINASSAACQSGSCQLSCSGSYQDCDAVGANGCEANIQTDSANCGSCGTVCEVGTPCLAGKCGCTPDADEPNESVLAPADLPVTADMRPLDANNTFLISGNRTVVKTFTLTSGSDIDVHHLVLNDDLQDTKNPAFVITLEDVPEGAAYSIRALYQCSGANTFPGSIFTITQGGNPVDGCDAGHGDWLPGGKWFVCDYDNVVTSQKFALGVSCTDDQVNPVIDDSGVLQIEVKQVTPPSTPTCAPYKLIVNVVGIGP